MEFLDCKITYDATFDWPSALKKSCEETNDSKFVMKSRLVIISRVLFHRIVLERSKWFKTKYIFQLGLVCFRLIGSDKLNEKLLSNINGSGKLHMVPASVNEKYVIRFCVDAQNSTEEDIGTISSCLNVIANITNIIQ